MTDRSRFGFDAAAGFADMLGSGPVRWPLPREWWGSDGPPAAQLGLDDLVRDGMASADVARYLVATVSRRRSVTVVAGPGGVGKTTLLTALLPYLPAGTRRVFLRGRHEPFDFRLDPTVIPDETVLLINEVSPHLPTYLWDDAVRRALRLGRQGYAIMATAHASSVEELVSSLTTPPLTIAPADIAALGTIVLMGGPTTVADAAGESGRPMGKGRVVGIYGLTARRGERQAGHGPATEVDAEPLTIPRHLGEQADPDRRAVARWEAHHRSYQRARVLIGSECGGRVPTGET